MTVHLTRRTRAGAPVALAILLACAACGSPGRDLVVDVAAAPRLSPEVQVGEEIGRLLSPEPAESRAAERRLIALNEEGRDRLVAYAAKLEDERDVRLLNVLDEHHALPEMSTEETLDFLLWKATREERFYVMKAQSRLLDVARRDPQALIERLRRGGQGFAVLAVVLAVNGSRDAVPALIERYRSTQDPAERSAAAEALGRLLKGAPRVRPTGSRSEIAADADALERWNREWLEIERDAAEEGDTDG